jgi:tetratricopeptide (TPR) repeat protein
LEQWPDNPQLLIRWASLVQLQEDQAGPTLSEAKAALQRAVELDDESAAAWIERGHFLDAVEDDAPAAARCFDKAIALCKRLLREALLGRARTLSELERPTEALACIAEAYWLQAHGRQGSASPAAAEILERLKDLSQLERLPASNKRVRELQDIREVMDRSV